MLIGQTRLGDDVCYGCAEGSEKGETPEGLDPLPLGVGGKAGQDPRVVLGRATSAREGDEKPTGGRSDCGFVAHGQCPKNKLGVQENAVISDRRRRLGRSGDEQPRQEIEMDPSSSLPSLRLAFPRFEEGM